MVKQQAEVFESLGTSDDAAKIRAQLQSAHLLSDMRAFKAANPSAVFNDFVRWHSPKDWVTEGIETPQLSARMSEPGNLWLELWQVCMSLFDNSLVSAWHCLARFLFFLPDCQTDSDHQTKAFIQCENGRRKGKPRITYNCLLFSFTLIR
jgi:hypothetical protein